ncbi:MAG: hypothetical protein Q9M89_09120 [Persephonella sp.]|nr:hypothetical protein [Persephonella sp.]
MHIRENSESNRLVSSDAFLQITAQSGNVTVQKEKKLYLSSIWKFVNSFEESIKIGNKEITVRYVDYYPVAEKKIVSDEKGQPMISVVFLVDGQPVKKILKYGEVIDSDDFVFSFGKEVNSGEKSYLSLSIKDGKFFIVSNRAVRFFDMDTQQSGEIPENKEVVLKSRRMYTVDGYRFVIHQAVLSGRVDVVPVSGSSVKVGESRGALVVELSYDGEKKIVKLLGGGMRANVVGEPVTLDMKDIKLTLSWGAKIINLPFYIYLKDFIVERYPGSMRPSSCRKFSCS